MKIRKVGAILAVRDNIPDICHFFYTSKIFMGLWGFRGFRGLGSFRSFRRFRGLGVLGVLGVLEV